MNFWNKYIVDKIVDMRYTPTMRHQGIQDKVANEVIRRIERKQK